jgi:hypothetical protein
MLSETEHRWLPRPVSLGRTFGPETELKGMQGKLALRRLRFVVVAGFTLALFGSLPATAIISGAPDRDRHPNVGALLSPDQYDDGTWADCTGTLISRTVFVTAAHCDPGSRRAEVTFDTDYEAAGGKVYVGTWHPHPGFDRSQDNPRDIAVVVFENPVRGINPAELPEAGSLADLSKDQRFTAVGYGAYSVTTRKGKQFHHRDVRNMAAGTLNATNPALLRISMNEAKGDGGTCYGDSGGPNFLGAGAHETRILAAITVTGDKVCRATNVALRLDTRSARSFLKRFVSLP